MEDKSKGQKLYDKLRFEAQNVWEKKDSTYIEKAFSFCDEYKKFLDKSKTEYEFVKEAAKFLKSKGFIPINSLIDNKTKLTAGTKIYHINREKSLIAAVIGKNALKNGINMIGAHIDAPRIDFKQKPLYEDEGFAMVKTHYYGGIKKYQWVTTPLSIHGVVYKTDGKKVNVVIGESDDDPVFTITDLLPHLAAKQMQKKMTEGITGESLNAVIGSIPFNDEKVNEKVKLNILKLLNEKYDICEEDFTSAELQLVPAFKASDVGLDRSMVGAYGQDDRVCSYIGLMSFSQIADPAKTALLVLTDKEEVGSEGNTGAESTMLENFVSKICYLEASSNTDLTARLCLENSYMLSADVNPAVDPNYNDVQDKRNASYMGKGLLIQKYTGVKGKVGGSEAAAEFISRLRTLFKNNDIPWQTAELGKVDLGGGGTIAKCVANLGTEVIDCGVSILSMHSPFEVTSKIDIYVVYLAFKAFFEQYI